MKEPTYIAGTLRRNFIEIPAHIPDHAWIFQRDTQNITYGGSWADSRITSVRNWPTFPPEKFHYYRKHGNARLLVSRNKREGRWLEKYRGRHRRDGNVDEDRYPHITELSNQFYAGRLGTCRV